MCPLATCAYANTTHCRRVGSITEVSEVMIRVTYTDKAIILECPPAEEHCVSNSSDGTTFITFLPNIESVAVPLIVSVGPEWMGGSALLEVKLVGMVNAVTQPPLDRMTIELLECEPHVHPTTTVQC